MGRPWLVLRLDGVDHARTVHVDGTAVAAHEGMVLPFEVDDNVVDLLPGESRMIGLRWRGTDPGGDVLLDGWNLEERRVH